MALIPAIYIITSLYDHTKRLTCGEHLLRCGINTSNIYLIMIITTLQYKQVSPEQPHIRKTTPPRSPHRASGAPPPPPRIAFRIAFPGFGKPPTRLNYCSLLYIQRHGFSVTQQGRVFPITRKGLTLLPVLVRRPQHLPLGCQPRSLERSTHDSLSINLSKCRTLPDSARLHTRSTHRNHTNFKQR